MRLGWEPGILNGNGLKPKGKQWRTCERLQAPHEAFVRVTLAGMARRLWFMQETLEDIDAAIPSRR